MASIKWHINHPLTRACFCRSLGRFIPIDLMILKSATGIEPVPFSQLHRQRAHWREKMIPKRFPRCCLLIILHSNERKLTKDTQCPLDVNSVAVRQIRFPLKQDANCVNKFRFCCAFIEFTHCQVLTLLLPDNLCCWCSLSKKESRRGIQPSPNVHLVPIWFSWACTRSQKSSRSSYDVLPADTMKS